MTDRIAIRPLGGRKFSVKVRDEAGETTHEVTVPEQLATGPEFEEGDLERAVVESFRFLLDREPASSILPRFSLEEIARYFPEYPGEIARRLG